MCVWATRASLVRAQGSLYRAWHYCTYSTLVAYQPRACCTYRVCVPWQPRREPLAFLTPSMNSEAKLRHTLTLALTLTQALALA